jgi:hypothetical protein
VTGLRAEVADLIGQRVPVAHLLDRPIGPDEAREPGAGKLPPRESPRYAAARLGPSRDRQGDMTLYLDDPDGNGSLTLDFDPASLAAVRAALCEPLGAEQVARHLDGLLETAYRTEQLACGEIGPGPYARALERVITMLRGTP